MVSEESLTNARIRARPAQRQFVPGAGARLRGSVRRRGSQGWQLFVGEGELGEFSAMLVVEGVLHARVAWHSYWSVVSLVRGFVKSYEQEKRRGMW